MDYISELWAKTKEHNNQNQYQNQNQNPNFLKLLLLEDLLEHRAVTNAEALWKLISLLEAWLSKRLMQL